VSDLTRTSSNVHAAAAGEAVRDRRIERWAELISPSQLFSELPLTEDHARTVLRGRAEAHAVLDREDDRLLVVVGPCSVHDPTATIDYAEQLAERTGALASELLVTMRVYFEKPRTTTGWKGLINDPHLDDSGDVNTGLRTARGVMLDVLALGLPVGCEFLDPFIPQYISDAVCWGAVGARTVESQTHRQLGSGLSMPVGFKNRTDGDVQVAADALRAAAVPQAFTGINVDGVPAVMHTRGNPDCHIILRGGRDAPNYAPAAVAEALEVLRAAGLPERVMIDCSHDNSRKDPTRQPDVAAAVAEQVADGNDAIIGAMLESFLVAGRQILDPTTRHGPLRYGQSITDACLDLDVTIEVLDQLAASVRARRGR
jgi:3-deoxy-7-phosphoheptulonate synthase